MARFKKSIILTVLFCIFIIMAFSSCGNPASDTSSPSEAQLDSGEEMLANIQNSISGEGTEPAITIELSSCIDTGIIHTINSETKIERFLACLDGLDIEIVYIDKNEPELLGGVGYSFTTGDEKFFCRQRDKYYYFWYKDNWYRINDEQEPYWVEFYWVESAVKTVVIKVFSDS